MNREKWVDVARCLGIYAIYLLHMGENIESAYFFFFKFVVALFFFLAGCTETYQKDLSFFDYVRLKVKRILLPTYMFVFLVVLVQLIQDENIMKSLGCIAVSPMAIGTISSATPIGAWLNGDSTRTVKSTARRERT